MWIRCLSSRFQSGSVHSTVNPLTCAVGWDVQGWFTCPPDGSGANADERSDDGQMPRFLPIEERFKGRHFDREIVMLCVRWYLSYKLSYRDLVAIMGERGIGVAHTTILRWVQHYSPEFERRWNRYARSVGGSWRCDETYIRP